MKHDEWVRNHSDGPVAEKVQARPLPASVQEETELTDDQKLEKMYTEDTETSDDQKTEQPAEKKAARPMPASVEEETQTEGTAPRVNEDTEVKTGDIIGAEKVNGEVRVLVKKDGKTVAVPYSRVTFDSRETARNVATAAMYGGTEFGRTLINAKVGDASFSTYARQMTTAYRAAKAGVSMEMLKASGRVDALTDVELKTATTMGEKNKVSGNLDQDTRVAAMSVLRDVLRGDTEVGQLTKAAQKALDDLQKGAGTELQNKAKAMAAEMQQPSSSTGTQLNTESAIGMGRTQDAMGMQTAFDYGYNGMRTDDLDNMISELGYELTEEQKAQLQEEFKKGQERRKQDIEKKKARAAKREKKAGGGRYITVEEAKAKGVHAVDRGGLNRQQRASIKALDALGKALGLEIVFFDSPTKGGSHSGFDGQYNSTKNIMYIDVSAGYAGENAMMRIAGHELTHYIQSESAELYEELRDYLLSYYGGIGSDTVNNLIARQMQIHKGEAGFDMADAMDEVVAEACQTMLLDEEIISNLAAQNRTMAQKVFDWFTTFIDTIREAIKNVGAHSKEAKLLSDNIEAYKKAQQLWLQALENAGNGTVAAEVQTEAATDVDYKTGKMGTAFLGDGSSIKYTYAAVDMEDLIASNNADFGKNNAYPQELQPRDRERAANREQVEKMAKNLMPERLGESADVQNGAPIVGRDMVVESGNGRVMAIRYAWDQGYVSGGNYTDWLRENAQAFGLNAADINDSTVLVRVRDTAIDRTAFVKSANESTIAGYSATEQARSDAEKITDDMLAKFDTEGSMELNAASNAEFIAEFVSRVIPANERNGAVSAKNQLSKDGMKRVQNALIMKAYNDETLLQWISEDQDSDIRNILNALVDASTRVAVLNADMAAEKLNDRQFAGALAKAVTEYSTMKSEGYSIKEYLEQTQLPGMGVESELQQMFMELFYNNRRSATKIAKAIKNICGVIESYGAPGQTNMFGDVVPGTVDMVQEALAGPGEVGSFNTVMGNTNTVTEMPADKVQNNTRYWYEDEVKTGVTKKALIAAGINPGSVQLGPKGYITASGRNILKMTFENNMKLNGMTKEDIDAALKFVDRIADFFDNDAVSHYRFVGLEEINSAKLMWNHKTGEIMMSSKVKNAEYEVNFDFTTVCRQRQALQKFFEDMSQVKGKNGKSTALEELDLGPKNILALNEILRREGYETACPGCFVEAKRYHIKTWAGTIVSEWNAAVREAAAKEGRTVTEYFGFDQDNTTIDKLTQEQVNALDEKLQHEPDPEKRLKMRKEILALGIPGSEVVRKHWVDMVDGRQ